MPTCVVHMSSLWFTVLDSKQERRNEADEMRLLGAVAGHKTNWQYEKQNFKTSIKHFGHSKENNSVTNELAPPMETVKDFITISLHEKVKEEGHIK